MSKAAVVSVVVAVVVLVGGGALLAANHKSNDKTDTTNTNSTPAANMNMDSSNNSTATPSATNSVTIENFAFSPESITIKKGTTVTWTNKDGATHHITETDGKTGPDSGNLASGKTYSFTYDSVGTFMYHCSIHPDMTGTVTVTE